MSMDIHTNLISWLNGVGSLLKDIGSSLQKQLFDVFSTNWNNCSPSTALNASFNFGHKGRWVNQVHQCFTKTASDLGDGPSSTVAAPPAGWVWWDGQPTRPGSGWVRLRVSRSGPGRASKSMLLQSSSRYNIFAVFQKKKSKTCTHFVRIFRFCFPTGARLYASSPSSLWPRRATWVRHTSFLPTREVRWLLRALAPERGKVGPPTQVCTLIGYRKAC